MGKKTISNKGFTLTEIVIVTVVLAILVGVVTTGVFHYTGTAHETTDIDNASAIYTTLKQLETDDAVCNWSYTESKTSPEKTVTVSWSENKSDASTATYTEDPKFDGNTDTFSSRINELLENGLPAPSSGGHFTIDLNVNGTKPYIVVSVYSDISEETDDYLIARFGDGARMAGITGKDLFKEDSDEDDEIEDDREAIKNKDKFKLLIHYVDKDGNTLEKDFVGYFKSGEDATIESPIIDGYTADTAYVEQKAMSSNKEVTVTYNMNGDILDMGSYFGVPWYVSSDGTLHLAYKGDVTSFVDDENKFWVLYKILPSLFEDSNAAMGIYAKNVDLTYSKLGIGEIEKVIIENKIDFKLDERNKFCVGAFSNLFNCTSIEGLDNIDFKNVTAMDSMFRYSSNLGSLDLDINSKHLVSASYMCSNMGATSINLNFTDAPNLITMKNMFYVCTKLTSVSINNLRSDNDINIAQLCLYDSQLSDFKFNNSNIGVINARESFRSCTNLKSIDLSDLDMKDCGSCASMFYDCTNLNGVINNWDLREVQRANSMFRNCNNLKNIDTSNWKFGNCGSFRCMFYGCYNLDGTIDTKGWVTDKTTDLGWIFFKAYHVDNIDVSDWDTKNVVCMYSAFGGMKEVKELDVSKWDVRKCSQFCWMFCDCDTIRELDVSNWHTDSADESYFDIKGDQGRYGYWSYAYSAMFQSCLRLTKLDIRNFKTTNIKSFAYMFHDCPNLQVIEGLADMDTSSAKSIVGMFTHCGSMRMIDMSKWDLSSIEAAPNRQFSESLDIDQEVYFNDRTKRLRDDRLKFPIKIYNGQDFRPHLS